MGNEDVLIGIVLDDACFTLEEFASACSVTTAWVVRHVEEGVLEVFAGASSEWRFTSRDLRRAQKVAALERDFDAVPELAALVADLFDELDGLRARLRRAGMT